MSNYAKSFYIENKNTKERLYFFKEFGHPHLKSSPLFAKYRHPLPPWWLRTSF